MALSWKIAAVLLATASVADAKQYDLPATPATVAWGHYDASTAPVLTVRSGDTVVVHTLLTNSPTGLEGAGLPADQVEPSLRAVFDGVPAAARGPGGHILTGPIAVEGAKPGDTLEVRILKAVEAPYPRAETPDADVAMGYDEDLSNAARKAVRNMISFLVAAKGMTRDDAYMLVSTAGDVNVTELVDRSKGVHVVLPKRVFTVR